MANPRLTSNSPSVGYVSWTAFNMVYQGKSYAFPAGNTNYKYTYWQFNNANGTPLQFTNDASVVAALTDDDCLLFLNKGGIGINALTSTMLDGDLIVPGSILADQIAANTITADRVNTSVNSGGLWQNAIADTFFLDANRRTNRSATDPTGAWGFQQKQNLTTSRGAQVGSKGMSDLTAFTPATGWKVVYEDPGLYQSSNGYWMGNNQWFRLEQITQGNVAAGTYLGSMTDLVPVTPGNYYAFEFPGTIYTGSTTMTMSSQSHYKYWLNGQITWLDASHNVLSTTTAIRGANSTNTRMNSDSLTGGTWQGQAPANAAYARMDVIVDPDNAITSPYGPVRAYLGRENGALGGYDGWLAWNDTWDVWPDEWEASCDASKLVYNASLASQGASHPYWAGMVIAQGIQAARGADMYAEVVAAANQALVSADSAGNYTVGGLTWVFHYPDGTSTVAGLTQGAWVEPSAAGSWVFSNQSYINAPISCTVDVILWFGCKSAAVAGGKFNVRLPGFGITGYTTENNRRTSLAPDNIQVIDGQGAPMLSLFAGSKGVNAGFENMLMGAATVIAPERQDNYYDDDPYGSFLFQVNHNTSSSVTDDKNYRLRLDLRPTANVFSALGQSTTNNYFLNSGENDNTTGRLRILAGRDVNNKATAKIKLDNSPNPLQFESVNGLEMLSPLTADSTLHVKGNTTLDGTLTLGGKTINAELASGSFPRIGLIAPTTAQNINASAWTDIIFSATTSYVSGVTTYSTTSVTIPEAGLYTLTAMCTFNRDSTGTGRRMLRIIRNGAPAVTDILVQFELDPYAAGYPAPVAISEAQLNAGDVIECQVYQSSSGVLTLRHDLVPARLTVRRVA